MENSLRIVIYIVLGVAVINLVMMFFEKSELKAIQQNIEKSQQNVAAALSQIQTSQAQIDSVRTDLRNFAVYIKDIQTRVELINTKKEVEEAKSIGKIKDLKGEIAKLEKQLQETDSLPPIEIKKF